MAKLTLTDISSGYALTTTTNANNALIEAALENTLSRDGTGPNAMNAALDMNSYNINNLPNATQNQQPITLAQAASIAGVTNALSRENVGAVFYPQTSAENAAGVTPTYYYYEPGDIRRYGGVGDDGTDNLTALNNALSSGEDVFIPNGIFVISAQATVPSNVVVYGNGPESIIKCTATNTSVLRGVGTISARLSDITIRDLRIQHGNGGAGTETGYPFQFEYVDRLKILNCEADSANQRGTYIAKCTNVEVSDCYFKDAGAGYTTTSGGEAIFINTCQYGVVSNNKIESSGRHAINVFRSMHITVTGNVAISPGSTLATLSGNADPSSANISVSSITRSGSTATVTTATNHLYLDKAFVRVSGANETEYNGTFEITRTGDTTFTYTVTGTPSTPATGTIVVNDTSGRMCTFSGNTVYNPGQSGFIIENEAHSCTVSGNTIYNAKDYGILISSGHGDGPEDCTVIGNTVRTMGTPVSGDGDAIRNSGSPRTSITGNTVYGAYRHAFRVNGLTAAGTKLFGNSAYNSGGSGIALSQVERIIVSDNYLEDCDDDGITAFEVNECVINGNIIINPSTGGASNHGIFVNYTTTASTNNVISNNVIQDTNGTPNMQDGINFESGCTGNRGTGNKIDNPNRNPVRYDESDNWVSESWDQVQQSITASGNLTFVVADGEIFFIDTNGSNRNFNPSGNFPKGWKVTVVNTGAQTIVFDSTGINQNILTTERGIFAYTGSAWVKVFTG